VIVGLIAALKVVVFGPIVIVLIVLRVLRAGLLAWALAWWISLFVAQNGGSFLNADDTKAAINDVILRGRLVGCPLIATDGFEYYVGVMGRLLGSACVYGQVLKTRRNNRVVRVERRVRIGTATRLNAALWASEDSATLNTSFVERLNLTIRQASAYLRRRSPCHARGADQLRSHVELVRCHYNFVRPHRALRFGRETRTPAMQAGLVSKRLALSDIFTARRVTLRVFVVVVEIAAAERATFSRPHEQRTAA
jgi:hypothetical protein